MGSRRCWTRPRTQQAVAQAFVHGIALRLPLRRAALEQLAMPPLWFACFPVSIRVVLASELDRGDLCGVGTGLGAGTVG